VIIHAALDRMRGGKQIDQDALDEFGAVLPTEVRDRAISWVEKFESGQCDQVQTEGCTKRSRR
jgi:hypothetical protein